MANAKILLISDEVFYVPSDLMHTVLCMIIVTYSFKGLMFI